MCAENSDGCRTDPATRARALPDGSLWLEDLAAVLAEEALTTGPPYQWRRGAARRRGGGWRWLIPLVAYAQVRAAAAAAGAAHHRLRWARLHQLAGGPPPLWWRWWPALAGCTNASSAGAWGAHSCGARLARLLV